MDRRLKNMFWDKNVTKVQRQSITENNVVKTVYGGKSTNTVKKKSFIRENDMEEMDEMQLDNLQELENLKG